MSRHFSSGSYAQRFARIGPDHYRLSWTVDRYTARSRLRFPTTYTRDTDHAGAVRFARKWELEAPADD